VSLIVGMFVIWIAAAAAGGWPAPVTLGTGALAIAGGALVAWRIGAFDREGLRGYARGATTLAYALPRFPAHLVSAFTVVSGAFGFHSARAGYVRMKLEPGGEDALGDVVGAVSAAPGALVVDADAGSVLVHAFDEATADVVALKLAERRAAGGRAP